MHAMAHAGVPVVDYMDSRLYPAHVVVLNFGPRIDGVFPNPQRLTPGHPITIEDWQVSLKAFLEVDPTLHNARAAHPAWGVTIYTGRTRDGDTTAKRCIMRILQRGYHRDCSLLVRTEDDQHNNSDKVDMRCADSIEFKDRAR